MVTNLGYQLSVYDVSVVQMNKMHLQRLEMCHLTDVDKRRQVSWGPTFKQNVHSHFL